MGIKDGQGSSSESRSEMRPVVLVVSLVTVTAAVVLDYHSAQYWRLYNVAPEEVRTLRLLEDSGDLEMMAMNVDTVDILLLNTSVTYVKEELDQMNMTVEVLTEDVQETVLKERQTAVAAPNTTCLTGSCLDWKQYYRLADIYSFLDYLQETYPQWVTVETIGLSAEQRPIKLVKVSAVTQANKNNTKAVWVDAGIHAREWVTPAAATYIVNELLSGLQANLTTFSDLEYYILPVMNPDGYEYTHTTDRFWRKNRSVNKNSTCIGTDLNRNWAYKWGGSDSKVDPCSSNFRGDNPFSEPETASVSSYILNMTSIIMGYLSLHSYGQSILFPWAHTYSRPPDFKDLYELAYYMSVKVKTDGGPYYRFGTAAESYYLASGGSQDWAKAEAKIKYSYTMELRDTGKFAFSLPAELILNTSKDAFSAFTVLSQKVKRY